MEELKKELIELIKESDNVSYLLLCWHLLRDNKSEK